SPTAPGPARSTAGTATPPSTAPTPASSTTCASGPASSRRSPPPPPPCSPSPWPPPAARRGGPLGDGQDPVGTVVVAGRPPAGRPELVAERAGGQHLRGEVEP